MPSRSAFAAGLVLFGSLVIPALSQPPAPPPVQYKKELTLGRHVGQHLEGRDGAIADPAVLAYAQAIANRVAAATGGSAFEVRLTRSPDTYARFLPQGVLYISGALFERLENEAELAGLLAHQNAHGPAAPVPSGTSTATVLRDACALASPLPPSRGMEDRREPERQATQVAIRALKTAGYDPSALLDLLSKLAYEHPAWATAIVPDDLLEFRVVLESDAIPPPGYMTDSSEFKRYRAAVAAALGHGHAARK